jgi:hypothetical protein
MRRWTVLLLVVITQISYAISIPSEVKNTIGFVFVPNANGEPTPNGTCFFVFVKDKEHPERGWGYMVTAKHVLQPTGGVFFPRVWIRINKKTGGTESLPIVLNPFGPQKNVFVHQDNAVDIAVVPIRQPDATVYDLQAISDEFLVSEKDFETLHIREGSDIFFLGMFLPHIGVNRNYPIVRFGKVALLTNEKVSWEGVLMDLYLVETFAFGGNSGSPVFFYLGSDREPGSLIVGPPVLKLAGILKGYFGDLEPIGVVETRPVPVSKLNSGIAAAV